MKKLFIAAMAAISAWLPAAAQQALTLDECKRMAVDNNAKMKTSAANIEAAEQDKKQAFTAYFPTVSAAGFAYTTDKGLADINMSPLVQLDDLFDDGVTGGITAVVPIFTGGQIVYSNKLAKAGLEVEKLYLEQTRNEVELTTEQYFWQIVSLNEKLRTVEITDSLLRSIEGDVRVSVEAGIALNNDLLRVELKKNDVESTKVDLLNNLAVCRLLLAQYIGLPTADFELVDSMEVGRVPDFPFAMRADHDQALLSTPEYRLLEKNVEVSKLNYKLEVGKNLPTVAAGAGYNYYHYFDALDSEHGFGELFATVTIPISGWWGGSHAIKKRKIKLANARIDLDDKSELLKIKMQKAWIDLENAYQQLEIAHKSIIQAAENLRVNTDCYKAGTISMSDLLDAVSLEQQCRDSYVDAFSKFQTKKLEYAQATAQE